MGRPKGSKNAGNTEKILTEPIAVTEDEKSDLSKVFTSIQKDFIGINDLMNASGLSYDICAKIIREIKAISDSFGISGYVHRLDYFIFVSRRFEIMKIKGQEVQGQ